jgi:hypothetical protein
MADDGMSLGNLKNTTALIQSVSFTQTTSGTANPTYATRIASLSCSVQPKKLETVDEFGKITLRNGYRLYCDYNATNAAIVEKDRVTWDSRTFEIDAIGDGAGRGHHFEIDMLEVK